MKTILDRTVAELPENLTANEMEALLWNLAALLLDRACSKHYARKWISENLILSDKKRLHVGNLKHEFEHNRTNTMAEHGGRYRHVVPSEFAVLLKEAGFRLSSDRQYVFASLVDVVAPPSRRSFGRRSFGAGGKGG